MKPIFELVPVVLSVIAIIVGAIRLRHQLSNNIRLQAGFGILAAILLMFAQTSWFSTLFFIGDTIDTSFADDLWTWFNLISMALIISNSMDHKD